MNKIQRVIYFWIVQCLLLYMFFHYSQFLFLIEIYHQTRLIIKVRKMWLMKNLGAWCFWWRWAKSKNPWTNGYKFISAHWRNCCYMPSFKDNNIRLPYSPSFQPSTKTSQLKVNPSHVSNSYVPKAIIQGTQNGPHLCQIVSDLLMIILTCQKFLIKFNSFLAKLVKIGLKSFK